MSKRVLTAILVAAATVPLTAVVSAPVQAATAKCELHIGLTSKSGNYIKGYGSKLNCGTGVSWLQIQRKRWYGWENLGPEVTVRGSGRDVGISYFCKGTGKHTWRTKHSARLVGGDALFKFSNEIRVTC
ncbi:hypothetical protein [Nonomuraea endophytica]|uniref:Uncharacterized protein n=1 Tax=Nonomuraea endophytica TaxID=714136 RepID=A0A7W8A6H7_9ACTN|nr:hypothetical protein [Nonomuraea endophytica]MBB5079128.1 hypothetical protein [Nonomuraea endophytica]